MNQTISAQVAVAVRDTVGEGPCWDAAGRRLIWSDNERGVIHEARRTVEGLWEETRTWTIGRWMAAAIPCVSGGLVVAAGLDILRVDDDGTVQTIARAGDELGQARFNDAKCDPQGRLWAGTLDTLFRPGHAALYRMDPDGSVELVLGGLGLANGLDWSPDGRTFYFADSLTRGVDAFDFDPVTGRISNQRTVFKLSAGAPNGLTVDLEGMIWIAATGTGTVQRYAPDGACLQQVRITTNGATSCAFGGEDGGELFITSLSRRMPDIALTLGLTEAMLVNEGPQAGALFSCRPGPRGAPATLFAD